MRWDGAIVVVTGASRGIGRAVAIAASAHGARVGLVARSVDDLEATRRALREPAALQAADVTDAESVTAAIGRLEDELGPTDIVVANAGVGAYGRFLDTDVETFEHLMEVNLFGRLHTVRAVLPGMVERGRGHVVASASIAGRVGAPFESAYSASKFAAVGLCEVLSTEVAPLGVGVSLVDPGPVATDFFEARGAPYGRTWPKPVPPSRVADAVIGAVEHGRHEVFVPRWLGAAYVAKTLFPALYRRGA